jgi:PAS domain S-box-containing protein
VGSIHDITERKRAEAALRENEERFRNLLQDVQSVAVQGYGPDGTTRYWNQASERLYGYSAQEAIGRNLVDLIIPPEMREGVEQAIRQMAETGVPIPASELSLMRKDGSRVAVFSSHTIVQVPGREQELFCIDIDLTERKQIEEKLIASENNFRQIAENIKEVFWISAPDWSKIYYISPAYYDVWGEEAEKLYEQPFLWFDSIIEEDKEKTRSCIPETITKDIKEIIFPDYRIKKSDGAIIWISARAFPIFDSEGNPHRIVGIAEDITARKQIEEEIRKLNDELEQRVRGRTAQLEASNKAMEAFSFSVSHDLRAPLRSIEGFSQALLEEYREKLDETGQNYLDRVCEAARRIGRLIDDTLKLSRVARFDFQCAAVDLSRMVREIAAAHQKSNPDRAVHVIIREGIIAQGDHHLLKIALENLVGNAIKFTGKETHPRIEFGKTIKDDETAYYVRDNGAGFDMAYVDKLFGPFQRLHTAEEFAGTGIGLATVQRIIARHGGRVWAEAEVGKGATFYFTLPS